MSFPGADVGLTPAPCPTSAQWNMQSYEEGEKCMAQSPNLVPIPCGDENEGQLGRAGVGRVITSFQKSHCLNCGQKVLTPNDLPA